MEASRSQSKRFFFRLRPYIMAAGIISVTSAICFQFTQVLGYYAVSFILLGIVSILATLMKTGPVLLASLMSLLAWNFFFIPPHNTFHIEKTEDILMFGMFGLVVIMNGVFTTRVRRQEQLTREREANTNELLQLTRKAKFLAESEKLYKTLFNSVSHELRIPVATIVAASEAMMAAAGKDSVHAALSQEIYTATLRLNRLIENLLNMSRLESGRIALRLDWYDLNDLVNKVISDLREELKAFTVRVNIADEMPLVRIDFGLMEQVLYNLVVNATQHAPVSSQITIEAGYAEGQLMIKVSDHGPGFPAEALKQVFNKFYRVDEKSPGGLGLGLSIVKGFTEAHQGSVIAENKPGGGAIVTVTIPSELPDMTNISMETDDNAQ